MIYIFPSSLQLLIVCEKFDYWDLIKYKAIIVQTEMSEELSQAWGELADFVIHKNSIDLGALNKLLYLAAGTSIESSVFSGQVDAFLETVSARSKSKTHLHSEALALLCLDALIYNLYRWVGGNDNFKPASSSFYGWMSMSHLSGDFSDASQSNERQSKKMINLIQDLANSQSFFKRIKLILDRVNNKEKNHRYGETLLETIDYILSKEKCSREKFLKQRARLSINPDPSKNKTSVDFHPINEVIFSNQLNKIAALLKEAPDQVHFALIRIYLASEDEKDRRQFKQCAYSGKQMLLNLNRYYTQSFEDEGELFQQSKQPLFRLLKNYLIVSFTPFFRQFHMTVIRLASKGPIDSAWSFYKANQTQISEELTGLIQSIPILLLNLLCDLSKNIEEFYQVKSETSINLVKKLLLFTFLCSPIVMEELLPQLDPSKFSNVYNYILNLFFQSSLKKFTELPAQKINLISSLIDSIAPALDNRIVNFTKQLLQEQAGSEGLQIKFMIKDPIINYDYLLIWQDLSKIQFTPKDSKRFVMIQEGQQENTPVYKHFKKQASIMFHGDSTKALETDLATWMSVGGSREYKREEKNEKSNKSLRERLSELHVFDKSKVKELNLLKSQFDSYLLQ